MTPLLAVVVIARNEARWIARTIESVLRAVAPLGPCDVVLVDSCSRDATVAIARRFPVRVVELAPGAPLSPALGRRVGQHLTQSRFVLFVDGDTELEPTWLAVGLAHLDAHPAVAGVGGRLREVYYRHGRVVGENPDCFATGPVPEDVDQLGGNALYRRAALEAVGSFNPFIKSYEEAELAERLRAGGWVVRRLPALLGTHHTGRPGTLAELRRRAREDLIRGYGQTLRVTAGTALFWAHARRMKRYLQFTALLVAGLLAVAASVAARDLRWAGAWLALCVLLLAAFMVRSRSVEKPLRLVMDWAFWSVPLVLGFLERPRDPRTLPVEQVIRSC